MERIKRDENGQNFFMRGKAKFIERTKDCYIKDGCEELDEYKRIIKKREDMGDQITLWKK